MTISFRGSALALALVGAGATAWADDITVTYVIESPIDVIGDPPRNVLFEEQYVSAAMFEPLVFDFVGRTGERGMRPALAVRWEAIDDLRWRFWLREGVSFHNGEPFTAEAVKFSIDRHLHPDFPGTDKFRDVPITAVEIIDDYTVDIVTEVPVPILPQRLSRNGAFIMSPSHYRDLPFDEAVTSPMGTGPYKFEEFRRDDRVILSRNDDWWGWDDKSNIDRLVFRIIPELSTGFSELTSGNVDIMAISPDLADVAEAHPDLNVMIADTLMRQNIIFNTQIHPAFQDARVRRALHHAIDVPALIDAFAFGKQEQRAITMINPPHEHPDLEPFQYDPDLARELLAEAGYPDGFSFDYIDVINTESQPVGEAVAQYWAQVGVNAGEVRFLEAPVMRERFAARTFSVHAMRWAAGENTPETDAWAVHDDRQTNSTHWVNQEWLDAYAELVKTIDQDRRNELNYKMQEILYEESPWISLFRVPAVFGVNKRIGGYNPHPSLLVEDWGAIYVIE